MDPSPLHYSLGWLRDAGAAKETVPTRAAVTSEPSNGDTYGRGDSVDVEVPFNKEVTVSGRPVLELTVGSPPAASAAARGGDLAGARASVTGSKRTATLVSGENERLHFRYVVQSSDGSPGARIIIASDALRLSGGSLIDARGERLDRANLSLDTAQVVHGDLVDGSLSEPAAARLVAVVSEPQADRTYRLGEYLLVEVQFDKGITVTGTPQLELAIDGTGSAARRARFVSTDHDTIRFRYDVQAADRDDDGIEVAAGALHLNGGSIRAAGGGSVELGRPQLALRIGSTSRTASMGGRREAGAGAHHFHLYGAQRRPRRRGNRHSGRRPAPERRLDPRRRRQRRRPEQQRGAAGGRAGGPWVPVLTDRRLGFSGWRTPICDRFREGLASLGNAHPGPATASVVVHPDQLDNLLCSIYSCL